MNMFDRKKGEKLRRSARSRDGERPFTPWGCGEDGQLGLDTAPVTSDGCALDWFVPTPTALQLPDDERVASHAATFPGNAIMAGSRNSLAVARSGALYSWQVAPRLLVRQSWSLSHFCFDLSCVYFFPETRMGPGARGGPG